MTLTKTLKIDQKLLGMESREAIYVAERIWAARGSPRESKALAAVLEDILTACQRSALRYPPVLLLRKKQLERGEFLLESPRAADGTCELCGGAGWYQTPAGTGTLCECGAWQKKGA
jgi:hypothetical protein